MKKLAIAALCLGALAGCASLSAPPKYYVAVAVRPDSQLPFQQSLVVQCPQVKVINIPEVGKAEIQCLDSNVQLSLYRGRVFESPSGQKSWTYEAISTEERAPIPANDPEQRARQEPERLMARLAAAESRSPLAWEVFKHR